jgi:hypothetical protein
MVNELNESRLVTLVRIALRDTERIWDLTVSDKSHMDRQGDDDLEEHLNELEMLEEGYNQTFATHVGVRVRSLPLYPRSRTHACLNRTTGEGRQYLARTSDGQHPVERQAAGQRTQVDPLGQPQQARRKSHLRGQP